MCNSVLKMCYPYTNRSDCLYMLVWIRHSLESSKCWVLDWKASYVPRETFLDHLVETWRQAYFSETCIPCVHMHTDIQTHRHTDMHISQVSCTFYLFDSSLFKIYLRIGLIDFHISFLSLDLDLCPVRCVTLCPSFSPILSPEPVT